MLASADHTAWVSEDTHALLHLASETRQRLGGATSPIQPGGGIELLGLDTGVRVASGATLGDDGLEMTVVVDRLAMDLLDCGVTRALVEFAGQTRMVTTVGAPNKPWALTVPASDGRHQRRELAFELFEGGLATFEANRESDNTKVRATIVAAKSTWWASVLARMAVEATPAAARETHPLHRRLCGLL